ncbi:hypothetical protein EV421DRAFT_1906476 [Armillaria borealis]|uniref:Uncharacterized protein n=1 Tax=Armillaria borealis TaxID=47425 RepID=A0AA39MM70_9AGAR|nr:hypothetical protein EV421DRAFT_1906476 [Armillaria borealis]
MDAGRSGFMTGTIIAKARRDIGLACRRHHRLDSRMEEYQLATSQLDTWVCSRYPACDPVILEEESALRPILADVFEITFTILGSKNVATKMHTQPSFRARSRTILSVPRPTPLIPGMFASSFCALKYGKDISVVILCLCLIASLLGVGRYFAQMIPFPPRHPQLRGFSRTDKRYSSKKVVTTSVLPSTLNVGLVSATQRDRGLPLFVSMSAVYYKGKKYWAWYMLTSNLDSHTPSSQVHPTTNSSPSPTSSSMSLNSCSTHRSMKPLSFWTINISINELANLLERFCI